MRNAALACLRAIGVDTGCQRPGVDVAVADDQAQVQLPGAAALTDDEVAQQALVGAPVERAQALRAGPVEDRAPRRVGALGDEQALGHRRDLVPAARRVETELEPALGARPERELRLVAVAPLLHGRHDRLHVDVAEAPEAAQRLGDLRPLDLELALVGQDLPRRAGVPGARRDPVGRRLEHLHRAGLGVVALALGDQRANAVAGHGAGDEDDVAVQPRHAVAAEREALDAQIELVAALRLAGDRGLHALNLACARSRSARSCGCRACARSREPCAARRA